ncbi:Heme response regulator HssR [Aliarcobacter thereius]|uniref:Heme response regulator HssR n=2 Tax=Aliarcobacter thereius TaxID=544718 RepID=A0A1C0B6T7_9BACT|nr:response regulator transcription factor [Aliarcobacter thereius]OCL86989.1 Heme response regulator HssR [Aliarcobacter thereius]OCL91172.1 Heme response regulator HssR [Aliarcobacter thereius]OCL95977.1 Heme response regulator HssR [Aliarcobacter thereius LMG 24486]OCL99306.1 Heme response regulator HssR [Aliarcobacter thereius]QBF16051.1 two-component system response regulator [Aliarcobacter thereius LMG 24486]
MPRILILEDDLLFANTLEDILKEENYNIDLAKNTEEALNLNYENRYDLYLFDINLTGQNGIDFLKTLRDSDDLTPTIFISSYKDKDTIKDAYINGCDDYIKKPVELDELLFKIKAIFKRLNKKLQIINLKNNISVDPLEKRVYKDNIDLNIPQKTVELLLLFLEFEGKIVSKELIIERLWNSSCEYSEGSIRVYVSKIKKVLDSKDCIKNIKAVGYRFEL